MRWLVLIAFLVLPTSASAAVYFSEIAWMGSAESANYEWIELHNDAGAVDVTGWTVSDGMNLEIELTGTITASAYAVLERTSDVSAAGTAFLIYTGALVNTGATLTLRRADGSVVDRVSGGDDWEQIGGDNTTKETAQYTSLGWLTAAPTPGRGITAAEVEAGAAVSQTTESEKTTGGPLQEPVHKEPTILSLPGVTLQLAVVAPKQGYVNQPVAFSVLPSGIGDNLLNSLQYEWNFGDGSVALGKETAHVFSYPGTYVVTVYGGFKRQERVTRHEITILPVAVSLTLNEVGDVQVNNDSPYEIDLSNYRVRADAEFVFPPRTILLPNQTITIPQAQLGQTNDRLVGVYDQAATLVASRLPEQYRANEVARTLAVNDVSPTPMISATAVSRSVEAEPFGFVESAVPELETMQAVVGKPVEQVTQIAAAAAAPLPQESHWPYVALMGTLLLGTLGVYVVPRRNESG